jgi:SAM-dependent methyltransferase
MSGAETDWRKYAELTKNKKTRGLLVRALPHVAARGAALDLGSGALNESAYLLAEGFARVVALDKKPVAQEIADTFPADRFSYAIAGMEEYAFAPEAFDLVNAQYSLPFIRAESLGGVWGGIHAALKPGGVFAGQLFGDRDGWAGTGKTVHVTKEAAEELCAGYEVLELEEEEKDGATAAGDPKHWHVFHFIVRKRQ